MMKTIGKLYKSMWLAIPIALAIDTSVGLAGDRAFIIPQLKLAQNREIAEPQSKPLAVKSLAVGGISISSSEAQIRSILGKPQQIDASNNELLKGKERYLYYNKRGIHGIQLIQTPKSGKFEVFSLLVNDVGSATHDGIKVGGNRQQLLKVYGTPNSIEQQGDDV